MNVLIGYMIDGRNSGIDKYLLRVLRVFYDAGIHADILTGKDYFCTKISNSYENDLARRRTNRRTALYYSD